MPRAGVAQATAIVPAKSFAAAKTRLADALDRESRERFAEAMLRDVLTALAQADRIESTVVVAQGARVRELAAPLAASVIPDPGDGHNAAVRAGLDYVGAAGAEAAIVVSGDCPLIDPDELDRLIANARPGVTVVPDLAGEGTNALLLRPPTVIEPAFGPGSSDRHMALARSAGVAALVTLVPSLALDIDSPADLSRFIDGTIFAPGAEISGKHQYVGAETRS